MNWAHGEWDLSCGIELSTQRGKLAPIRAKFRACPSGVLKTQTPEAEVGSREFRHAGDLSMQQNGFRTIENPAAYRAVHDNDRGCLNVPVLDSNHVSRITGYYVERDQFR